MASPAIDPSLAKLIDLGKFARDNNISDEHLQIYCDGFIRTIDWLLPFSKILDIGRLARDARFSDEQLHIYCERLLQSNRSFSRGNRLRRTASQNVDASVSPSSNADQLGSRQQSPSSTRYGVIGGASKSSVRPSDRSESASKASPIAAAETADTFASHQGAEGSSAAETSPRLPGFSPSRTLVTMIGTPCSSDDKSKPSSPQKPSVKRKAAASEEDNVTFWKDRPTKATKHTFDSLPTVPTGLSSSWNKRSQSRASTNTRISPSPAPRSPSRSAMAYLDLPYRAQNVVEGLDKYCPTSLAGSQCPFGSRCALDQICLFKVCPQTSHGGHCEKSHSVARTCSVVLEGRKCMKQGGPFKNDKTCLYNHDHRPRVYINKYKRAQHESGKYGVMQSDRHFP